MKRLTKQELEELLNNVRYDIMSNTNIRIGQSFFNNLITLHPEFENIRGTPDDPFYNNKVLLHLVPIIIDKGAMVYWKTTNIYRLLAFGHI